ncbi:putative disease resistance RPP13-like protein 1 [Arachis ipaensis]|uniref:putative disease resistance RPP13-like protein 1 n=1 Tax=Arachis ipaensis TaxID=130454 RepID=UPI000A2B924E|nr:putative disease resistance RPP13-like protein 1 [Arachis ipaensis]XP_020970459.1 putative disease resistance RPP13-like protein 1 [Arachis ipaensis]
MAAEAVLSSVLSVVFDRMSSPEVVNWIKGKKLTQKLIERLKTNLYAVQAFLIDAEQKQIKERPVKDWLDSLKHAMYLADDLLDEVFTKAATQKDPGTFLSRFLNLKDRDVANRMEEVIDRIESLVIQKDTLGLREIPKENMSWRITTSLVETSDVCGREEDKEAIVKLLLDDDGDDDTGGHSDVSVIPIVGMGGIGKTTLAQLVYQDGKVKENFDFQAWICVSEEFDVFKVTKTIIEAITKSFCSLTDLNLLQHDLKEKLSRKKFFVVLDDVWSESYEDWDKLLKPFRKGVKGSKILITTRSKRVASVVQTVSPYELSLLSEEDCWLVFSKHARLSTGSMENPTLRKVGRDLVKKCDGLPLAAQALGGLLRGNSDVKYWNHLLKSEIWELSHVKIKVVPALKISYYYLPSYLKECFVYCSLYPKDYEFSKEELILLWMAENFLQNFLQPAGKKTPEEVGDKYFDELVARSFFQPHSTLENIFVMHDLVHDLAMIFAGEFYFRAEEFENAVEVDIKTRYLSHNAKGNYPISKLLGVCDRVKHTRTFLEINLEREVPFNMENAPYILLSKLKYLRALSFKFYPLESLPDSIGKLIHLRYLDLSWTCIMTLPDTLRNLYNLQTLKLVGCRKLKALPVGMKDLTNLRYLDIRWTGLQEMPEGMSKLTSLQVLSNYIVGEREGNKINELGALANLHQTISIDKLENVVNSSEALEARMFDKDGIESLILKWSPDKYENIVDSQIERDILEELRPHSNLKQLQICGYRGTTFPDWLGHCSYHNITQITLGGFFSGYFKNCCMLPSLGQLPSLKLLEISKFERLAIVGAEFYRNDASCMETPFPMLETLIFESMPCWKEWRSLEFNAFPRLRKLIIWDCPMLSGDLPNQLPSLQSLDIENCKLLSCCVPRAAAITSLRIEGSKKVRIGELPPLLDNLSINGKHQVESVKEAIAHTQLTCLTSLSISGYLCATGDPHSSLRYLIISYCEKQLSCVASLFHGLTHLHIEGECESVKYLPKEGWLPATLESLTLDGIKSVEMLECKGLAHLTSLQQLSIHHCSNMENIDGEKLPSSLLRLSIYGSPLGKRCEKKDPQVWPKISHIPAIQVDARWIS